MPDYQTPRQQIHTPSSRQTSSIGQGTVKLYYEDAYLQRFGATVLHCQKADIPSASAGSRYAVILDRTAFFPEEGGQSPDKGFLKQDTVCASVCDVQIQDGLITHYTDQPFRPGDSVIGELDFHHRFSNMQQHSAEHLFSGLVWQRFGWSNVGFHLSDTEVTMDYSGKLTAEEAAELELEVNRIIWKNLKSRQEFPSPEELEKISYRSKIEIDGQVRLVIFPGCDVCACCAPHVAETGEIGLFKVLSVQNYKGGVRIHMLAGERAFRVLAAGYRILTDTAQSLSTSPDQVPSRVQKLRDDAFEARRSASEAAAALLQLMADSVSTDEKNVCLFTEELPEPVLRQTVNHLMEKHAGICGVFSGSDGKGYRYIIGSTGDIAAAQKLMKEQLQARGGGRPPLMQGSVPAGREQISELFRSLP